MNIKELLAEIDIRLLRLLFSDATPSFVDAGTPNVKGCRWLAWHMLISRETDEIAHWLNSFNSPGFSSFMQYRLTECIAWAWLIQYNRHSITKKINVLEKEDAEKMRTHLNNLRPYFKQWCQQEKQKTGAA